MDKIKSAKISLDDGASYSEEIPIGAEASNVDLPDGTNLGEYLEDMKIANELKASLKSARLRNYQGEVPVGARSLTIGSNNRAVGEDSFAEGKATYAVGNFVMLKVMVLLRVSKILLLVKQLMQHMLKAVILKL